MKQKYFWETKPKEEDFQKSFHCKRASQLIEIIDPWKFFRKKKVEKYWECFHLNGYKTWFRTRLEFATNKFWIFTLSFIKFVINFYFIFSIRCSVLYCNCKLKSAIKNNRQKKNHNCKFFFHLSKIEKEISRNKKRESSHAKARKTIALNHFTLFLIYFCIFFAHKIMEKILLAMKKIVNSHYF